MKILKKTFGALILILFLCTFLLTVTTDRLYADNNNIRPIKIVDPPDLPEIYWDCGDAGPDPRIDVKGLKGTPDNNGSALKSGNNSENTNHKDHNYSIILDIIKRMTLIRLMGFKTF